MDGPEHQFPSQLPLKGGVVFRGNGDAGLVNVECAYFDFIAAFNGRVDCFFIDARHFDQLYTLATCVYGMQL